MNAFFLISLFSLLFSNEVYIKSTIISNHFIRINYTDSSYIKIRVKKKDSKKYFTFEENNTVYIDADQNAKWTKDIDSLLKVNTHIPQYVSEYLPILYLVFIVDKNGNIISKGLDRDFSKDEYQDEFYRLMKLVDDKLQPAIVDGNKVASILKLQIDYYKLTHGN